MRPLFARCEIPDCGKAARLDSYLCLDCTQDLIALQDCQDHCQPLESGAIGTWFRSWRAITANLVSCVRVKTLDDESGLWHMQ
jgi:hypothetical protein